MTPLDLGTILVALIAALGAWAAQRTAAKATKSNTIVSGKIDAETGAYERARTFDIQTIERQNAEIHLLRESNEALRRELYAVKARLARLEGLAPEIVERLKDEGHYQPDDG